MITTQVLKYEQHEDEIALLSHAIELISKNNQTEAIGVLMAFREQLVARQTPTLKVYDQREERLA